MVAGLSAILWFSNIPELGCTTFPSHNYASHIYSHNSGCLHRCKPHFWLLYKTCWQLGHAIELHGNFVGPRNSAEVVCLFVWLLGFTGHALWLSLWHPHFLIDFLRLKPRASLWTSQHRKLSSRLCSPSQLIQLQSHLRCFWLDIIFIEAHQTLGVSWVVFPHPLGLAPFFGSERKAYIKGSV